MKMKKSMIGILTAMMVVTAIPTSVPAVEANNPMSSVNTEEKQSELSGKCGKNATWVYNPDTKTITISGKGKLDTEINNSEVKKKARKVIVEKGITKIDIALADEDSKVNEIQF